MAGLMDELLNVLEKQLGYYNELIDFALQKKDIIIKNDTSSLSVLTNSENSIVGRIQRLDKSRVELINDIGNVLNSPPDKLTLTVLSELLQGKKEKIVLDSLIERTRKALDDLRVLNEQNKILVENSLEYIDFTINVIRSSLSREPDFYTSDGKNVNSRAFFDAKQ